MKTNIVRDFGGEKQKVPSRTKTKRTSNQDDCFGVAIKKFKITIPPDWNIDIDTFVKKVSNKKTTRSSNSSLNNENLKKAVEKLVLGEYEIKIFSIAPLSRESSQNCLNFLEKQKAVLVGMQGLMLMYDLAKDQFPKEKWVVSFNKNEPNLPDGYSVPVAGVGVNSIFEFDLFSFKRRWADNCCLLCICKVAA